MGLGAALGAVTGVGGLAGGIYAGNKAASAGRHAANEAYDSLSASKGEALGRLDPYSEYGQQAMVPLSALLYGKNYDTATGKFTGDVAQGDRFNAFQQSPGYQYQLDQGLKAVERRNAATGTLLSGNTQKELQEFGSNLANQDYDNFINQLIGQLQVGQNADTNAANVIQGLGGQMAGYQYAGGMANAQKYSNLSNFLFSLSGQGFGAAMDSGGGGGSRGFMPAGAGGGSGGGFVPAGGGMYNSSYFSQAAAPSSAFALGGGAAAASDINLKENIVKVGEDKGFNIYEFNYIDKPSKRYRGVMAQEVKEIMPAAVVKMRNGFYAVCYAMLGLEMEEV